MNYCIFNIIYTIVLVILNKLNKSGIFLLPFVYSFIWTFSICCYLSCNLPLIPIKSTILFWITFGNILFTCGYLFFRCLRIKKIRITLQRRKKEESNDLNEKILGKITNVGIISFIIIFLFSLITYFQTKELFPLKISQNVEALYNTFNFLPYYKVLMSIFLFSFPFALMHITFIFSIININKKWLYIALSEILIYEFCYGDRIVIFRCIIYLTISLIYYNKDLLRKHKKKIIASLMIAIGFMIILSLLRSNKYSFEDYLTLYFGGPLSFFQYSINNLESYGYNDPLTFGYLTFGFIFEPVVLIIKAVFGLNIDVPSALVNQYTQIAVPIGLNNTLPFNNSITSFYVFIRDFGSLGVFIMPLFYSYFTSFFERYSRMSYRFQCLFVYIVGGLFTSVFAYSFAALHVSFAFIIILVCTRGEH